MSRGKRADATGRSTGVFADPKFRKRNQPPQDENWVWFTRGMIESPALRALSGGGLLVVFRVALEHLAHGGAENGSLPIPYTDFVSYGIRRGTLREYIAEATALGFIARTSVGRKAWGDIKGVSARYRVTWLPSYDGTPATNEWKRFTSMEQAEQAAKKAREAIAEDRRRERNQSEPEEGDSINSAMRQAAE
jgi:hypothetical protein